MVKRGRVTGIFDNWNETAAQVNRYPNAKFKSFADRDSAERYFNSEDFVFSDLEIDLLIRSGRFVCFADGSGNYADGRGGYACIILKENSEVVIYGGESDTTVNRMELMAAITALSATPKSEVVYLYTDSRYVVDFVGSVNSNSGWSKSNAPNLDLLNILEGYVRDRMVFSVWVKGHSGNKYNEICDKYAAMGANGL